MGAKKNPFYRIVVADSRSPRDGRCIEEIGTYDPLTTPSKIDVDMERADYWIKNGAQPTDTVRALLKKASAGETGADATRPVKKGETKAKVKADASEAKGGDVEQAGAEQNDEQDGEQEAAVDVSESEDKAEESADE